jgi:hypothetical protein
MNDVGNLSQRKWICMDCTTVVLVFCMFIDIKKFFTRFVVSIFQKFRIPQEREIQFISVLEYLSHLKTRLCITMNDTSKFVLQIVLALVKVLREISTTRYHWLPVFRGEARLKHTHYLYSGNKPVYSTSSTSTPMYILICFSLESSSIVGISVVLE